MIYFFRKWRLILDLKLTWSTLYLPTTVNRRDQCWTSIPYWTSTSHWLWWIYWELCCINYYFKNMNDVDLCRQYRHIYGFDGAVKKRWSLNILKSFFRIENPLNIKKVMIEALRALISCSDSVDMCPLMSMCNSKYNWKWVVIRIFKPKSFLIRSFNSK